MLEVLDAVAAVLVDEVVRDRDPQVGRGVVADEYPVVAGEADVRSLHDYVVAAPVDLDPREDTSPRPDPRATDHPYPRAADYLEQADRLGGDYSGPGRKGQRDVRLIRHTDSVSQGVGAGGDAVGVVRGDQTREERPEVFARTRKPGEPWGVGLGRGHGLGDAHRVVAWRSPI